jgi:predicted O-linked N-acetylglucosamine transferase (SPINDLY family)
VEALYNRARLQVALGQLSAGLVDYEQALGLKPDHYDAMVNRANVLIALQRNPEAIGALRQAVALDATRLEGWYNLANALADSGEINEQLRALQTVQAISPTVDFVRGSLLNLQMRLCDWHNLAAELPAILGAVAAGLRPIQPFPLLALTDTAALQKQSAQGFCTALTGAIAARAPAVTQRRPGPIRVGYFSTHMCSHAVATQTAQLYELHDKTQFEVFGYALSAAADDAVHRRLLGAFDHFADLSTLSDAEAARRVQADELDIAVDLNGYTASFRSGLFALGCAPVQVAYLGYAGTTGAPYMDYLIADRVVIPEESRQHYSEQIVYLPDSFMVNDNTRVRSERVFTRAELGLPEQGFVFRCYNNSYKILPEVFDCWMRLLQQLPGSVLWLLDENPTATANLKREAQQRGIDPARLVFSGRIELSEHFARNRVADLFLDTFPYTAHSTACDALWSGLPVLTRMGESFASRVAGSLLTAMNLPELITHSLAEYEARALHLAQHPQELAALRERLIANRDSGPLFDTARFARHIEAAYTLMHQRRVDGLPPVHLNLTDSLSGLTP